jgi:hypothetical protein
MQENKFNQDIFKSIFIYLNVEELFRVASLVCKKWYNLIFDETSSFIFQNLINQHCKFINKDINIDYIDKIEILKNLINFENKDKKINYKIQNLKENYFNNSLILKAINQSSFDHSNQTIDGKFLF